MRLVLVGDIGSTNVRTALVDSAGCVHAQAARAAPVATGHGARHEIEPELWWQCFRALAEEVLALQPNATIAGVALCGMTRAQVLLDAGGQIVRPAMTWADTRSETEAEELARLLGDDPERQHINAYHPLARLLWIKRHEPDLWRRVATVFDPKDYVNFRLTGVRTSDPVSLARLRAALASPRVAEIMPQTLMPPLGMPWSLVGPVSAPDGLPRLVGVSVFTGANDTWAAVTGLGAMQAGRAYNISGTTEVLGVLSTETVHAEGLISLDWCNICHIGGPSQNGADVAAWAAHLLSGVSDALDGTARALDEPAHPQPLLFLPYLRGERVPYWDSQLRGAFLGLSREHRAGDFLRAILEGVAFQNRLVLRRAETALGYAVDALHFGGGGAVSPAWAQIKADVTARPVVVAEQSEPGLAGAAALCWTGLGVHPTLIAAQAAMTHMSRRFVPDAARVQRYDRLFALYRQAEAAVLPISHALASFPQLPPCAPGQPV